MQAYYAIGDRQCPACERVVNDLPGMSGKFRCPWCQAILNMTYTIVDCAISFQLRLAEG